MSPVSNEQPKVSIERPAIYVVATPIGNLGDISRRAIETLRQVDTILAEDTRTSAKLLEHFGVRTQLRSMHEHNERRICENIVAEAHTEGQALALISDAGTPLISDPGYHLVGAAHAGGLPVHVVPGPCAAVAALAVSGLATDEFIFIGFLPAKAAARSKRIEALATETRTMVFYEAPHRIRATLNALQAHWGGSREVLVAREMTKKYETLYRGQLTEVIAAGGRDSNFARGEIVIVVAGINADCDTLAAAEGERVLAILLERLPASEAVKTASEITGMSKNRLYRLVHEKPDQ